LRGHVGCRRILRIDHCVFYRRDRYDASAGKSDQKGTVATPAKIELKFEATTGAK